MSNTLVVNLFGVPGAGKSTGAAYIFSCIKMAGVNAELITEYAKDKVWERNDEAFRNQASVIFSRNIFNSATWSMLLKYFEKSKTRA